MWSRSYFTSLTLLSLLVLFLVGPDCGPAPATSLRLVDANDQDLGMFVQEGSSFDGKDVYVAFHETLGARVGFRTTTDGSTGAGALLPLHITGGSVFFAGAGCQGAAYVAAELTNSLVWIRPSAVDRFFVPSGSLENDPAIQSRSTFAQKTGGNDTLCVSAGSQGGFLQVATEVLLPFTEPAAPPLRAVPPIPAE